MNVVGRLAPTPSGLLHLGNIAAFGLAWLSARAAGGRVLLRVEDVDKPRARRAVEDAQKRDLDWLGLTWDEETRRQSERDYLPWLHLLGDSVYACTCTRAEVADAGGVYPGTCRGAGHLEGAWRFRVPPGEVLFYDRKFGAQRLDPNQLGDPVIRRRDGFFAYPLAVVADDLTDGVTEVVRGADLLPFTAIQVRLWQAFGATPPTWLHAPLILGADGKKLSKSHGSAHIGAWREAGRTPQEVWRVVLPWLGVVGIDTLEGAISALDPARGPRGPIIVREAAG
jgi:glutamyl/glutaminyl-tRNA synthetase